MADCHELGVGNICGRPIENMGIIHAAGNRADGVERQKSSGSSEPTIGLPLCERAIFEIVRLESCERFS